MGGDLDNRFDDLSGATLGVPAEVDDLPAPHAGAQIPVLVKCLTNGTEVEPAAVPFDRQLEVRKGMVEAGHELALLVAQFVLGNELRQCRLSNDPLQHLLQPRLRDGTLALDLVKQPQEQRWASLTGAMRPLCGEAKPQQTCAVSTQPDQRLVYEVFRDNVAKVGECPRDASARDAVDRREVVIDQAVDLMHDDVEPGQDPHLLV